MGVRMKTFYVLMAAMLVQAALHAQIKVACIGNSITYGSGLKDRDSSYPSQLGRLLGSGWEVKNFGNSGSTLLSNGNKPYRQQAEWKQALAYLPNVVVIKLGTNDSKPQNWQHKAMFSEDYRLMIDSLSSLPSHPMVLLCLPVPAFPGNWGISDSIMRTEVIPQIKKVASETGAGVIDLYKPLANSPQFFPDTVHPNGEGAAVIASVVAQKLGKMEKAIRRNMKKAGQGKG
jgi:lysophospholipase L1-like esterase